jgi:LCP family protein required for cell wall assembly
MAEQDKPYRVYRGGRAKGKVPLAPRPQREPRKDGGAPKRAQERPRRRPRWGRRVAVLAALLVTFLVVWTFASYLAFRGGVETANGRLSEQVQGALAEQDGMLISNPSQILLLGTDGDGSAARADARRADSIQIVRTDPTTHRIAFLSIPRDLRVDIPGYGPNKINSAYQIGGPALTLRTIKALTGLDLNHVIMVNFDDFKTVIDKLGGVEVDVPKPIVSNRFDCPYATDARCQQWEGWKFAKGTQTMNGRRALVYSRIRENRLDLAENDLTRGERQQAVVGAMKNKLTSVGTFLRLPFIGDELVSPLTTDLSAGQVLQLGWVGFRANDARALHCRLGGTPSNYGGQSVLIGTEENVSVLSMFTGRSAPQPPLPGSGPFGAGCVVG